MVNLKLIYRQVYIKFIIIDAYNKVDRLIVFKLYKQLLVNGWEHELELTSLKSIKFESISLNDGINSMVSILRAFH